MHLSFIKLELCLSTVVELNCYNVRIINITNKINIFLFLTAFLTLIIFFCFQATRFDAFVDSNRNHSFYHHLSPYITGPTIHSKIFLTVLAQVLIGLVFDATHHTVKQLTKYQLLWGMTENQRRKTETKCTNQRRRRSVMVLVQVVFECKGRCDQEILSAQQLCKIYHSYDLSKANSFLIFSTLISYISQLYNKIERIASI